MKHILFSTLFFANLFTVAEAQDASNIAYAGITPAQKGKTIWRKRVTNDNNSQQEIIALSKEKWQWMAEKNTDTLAGLFHEKSMFVHMSGSWGH